MYAVVHAADIQDGDGGILALASMFGLSPFPGEALRRRGPRFRNALAKVLPRLSVDVVKRSDGLQGFKVLPRRWVVERSFAWLNGADDWPSISRT
jgi:hypothetical protein